MQLQKENKWKVVERFPHLKVNTLGNVFSIKHGRLLNGTLIGKEGNKYLSIGYREGKKVKHIKVHILIATAFIDNPKNKPFVNHKDGNKLNNHYQNLEWVTSSENCLHALKTGLRKSFATSPISAIKNINISELKSLANQGKSQKELAMFFNANQSTISRLLNKLL